MDMLWLLIREESGKTRAVQFKVFTGWEPDWDEFSMDKGNGVMPADFGYHSPEPMYEEQQSRDSDCPWIGGKCYYDGSGLHAEEAFKIFVREGEEALWRHMEAYYRSRFGA